MAGSSNYMPTVSLDSSSDDQSPSLTRRSPTLTEIVLPAVGGLGGAKEHTRGSPQKRRGADGADWMLPGEFVKVTEDNVGYLSPVGKLYGRVIITNFRLCFASKDQTASGKVVKECQFFLPLGAISRVEKIGHSNVSRGEDAYGLEIICKDIRNVKLTTRQENHSRRPLFESLQKYAFPLSNKLGLFAFSYECKFPFDGWSVFDLQKEYRRQGVPNDTWTFSRINERYEFSESYPSLLCIPSQAQQLGEDFLHRVGAFRSKARIPILSWIHPESQATISRCSQPMVGMTGRRCPDDEKYLQLLIDANAQSAKLFIMDARPEVNAKVNKAKGGGYEGEEAYKDCELVFLDIQNIHVMRESLRKLKEICFPRVDDRTWFSSLDDTNWLEHIKLILLGAVRIVDKVENHKTSVLVHCSDGWDRTAQLTGLAKLMLDSYYRTVTGFEVLIETEWCCFGHKFAQRVGHGEEKHSDAERSPIFVQFIDAVWQLSNQFPHAFEFNSRLLILILDELYACRFGTFLFNTDQQRFKESLREKTQSLWSLVNSQVEHYLNPFYNPKLANQVLIPNCSQRRIKLWNEYYLRHNPVVGSQDRAEELSRVFIHLLRVRECLSAEVERLQSEQIQPPPCPTTPTSPTTHLV